MSFTAYIEDFIWFLKKINYKPLLERNNGFFDDGIHYITRTHYDPDGYDIDGFNSLGYNNNNFRKDGFNDSGYNQHDLDRDGFNKEGLHYRTKLTRDEFSKYNFSLYQWHKAKSDLELSEFKEKTIRQPNKNFNEYDFDENGFHKYLGFNLEGFDRDGYDENGYDINGWDKYGFDSKGIHIITNTLRDNDGYDKEGFDQQSCGRDGQHALEIPCIYSKTYLTKQKAFRFMKENYSFASQIEFKAAWDDYRITIEDVFEYIDWDNKKKELFAYLDEDGKTRVKNEKYILN